MQVPAQAVDGLVYISLTQLMGLAEQSRGLSFLARQPRHSLLAGNHASRLRGRGLNFDELRRYQPGDDLRHLDWRASLRTGKAVVRSFTEERDRPALIVVDQRMSMFFGSKRSFKSALAAELGALAAWLVFNSGDRVGGLVFNDQRIDSIAPLRSRARVQALCAHIVEHNQQLSAENPDSEGDTQLDSVLQRCLALAGHDHLICLISDFAGCTQRTLQLLRQLRAHNDVLALQVYDPIALIGEATAMSRVSSALGRSGLLREKTVAVCLMFGDAAFAAQAAPTQRPSIEQLKEIALPPPLSYTPQTWGWAALGVLLITLLSAYAAWRLWHWRQNRYRRVALQRLTQIERAGNPEAFRELPELLKRVALSMPGNPAVATLQGQAWQQFLQQHSKQPLPADFSQQLAQLAYAPLPSGLDTRQLLQHSRQWVEGHHVAA